MIRKISAVALAVLTVIAMLTACSAKGRQTKAAPYIIFGENGTQSGMSYTVNGSEKLSYGSLGGREYIKIDSKKISVNFKLDNSKKI